MREAIGGSMLFYIVMTIIVLYIVFIAFIMNYASTYRAANYVVSQFEVCNGDLSGGCKDDVSGIVINDAKVCADIKNNYNYADYIKYSCQDNNSGSVYRVGLGIEFNLPFVGNFKVSDIKVETKTIYNVKCSDRPSVYGSCFRTE